MVDTSDPIPFLLSIKIIQRSCQELVAASAPWRGCCVVPTGGCSTRKIQYMLQAWPATHPRQRLAAKLAAKGIRLLAPICHCRCLITNIFITIQQALHESTGCHSTTTGVPKQVGAQTVNPSAQMPHGGWPQGSWPGMGAMQHPRHMQHLGVLTLSIKQYMQAQRMMPPGSDGITDPSTSALIMM